MKMSKEPANYKQIINIPPPSITFCPINGDNFGWKGSYPVDRNMHEEGILKTICGNIRESRFEQTFEEKNIDTKNFCHFRV